ncbi:MAG TPA: phosphotransferase [Acidimicrobiales bacterium]|nr:phosphotransferase [Acidimicrobiales bacterium]
MTSWVERSRAHRATVPSSAGVARLSAALGEPVELEGPLHGGVAASTWAIRTPTRRLVLKRFRPDDDTGPLEWVRLQIAVDTPVPTPEPIAFDPDGEWFGVQSLVMSHLPGAVVYPPVVEELARTLAALHSTVVPEPVPEELRRPGLWTRWEQTAPVPDGVLDALADLLAIAERQEHVLCHCDFHPGNVLVENGAVTGVLDWSSARFAPRAFDVALMRCDLAIEPGGDAPRQLLAAYEKAAGVRLEHLGAWDVLAAARAIEDGAGWVDAWSDAGVEMTAQKIHDRAWAFAEAALS